jgi:carbonic anhydrase/acetyltransferase-like protein (isoleucine patch superfamily)
MPVILPVKDVHPKCGNDCFIAPNATIVGDVAIGNNCSIWFNAVVRGDVNKITIGNESNIQDGAVIHATYLKAATTIGNRVSVGHNAIVHGCDVKDHVLIGMGAIVMDHAIIEPYCIIAAGAVVLENMICESGHLYAGTPAKKIKPITDAQRALLDKLPDNYVMYAGWFNP